LSRWVAVDPSIVDPVKYQAIEFVVEQSEKAEQMTTSPLLTGGAGFDFEDSVAAVYLTALLLGRTPWMAQIIWTRLDHQKSKTPE
jgi:hypothetical protein